MKKLLFCATLMCAAMFSSCGDEYDDTALRKEMESIKDRVAALEERLTQEVNTLKGLIEAAEEGLAVSVEETADGYEITIGDGEPITIYHGKDGENGTDGTNGTNGTQITVVEVDGVYYWAINGEATDYRVTGNDGEDGEDGEDGYTPEIKDGKWYINGEEVGPATGENGEDGDSFFKDVTVNDDDTVTFTLANDTTITVALAKSAKYTDVQSIKFVPEYEDGKVTVGYYTGAEDAFVVAKYEVTPKAAAATIAKYAKDASMQAVYTKTRAEAGELVELPVTAIEAEEGIITVTATAADLAEEFFAGTLSASIRFAVQDDLSGNASEYVAAVAAKAELPAMEVAAVAEGYQAAKLTWSEVAGAAYYQIKAGADVVAKAEGVTEFVVEKLTAANKYAFTVEACTSADKVLTSGSTEEIQIFSLTNRPEPEIRLVDGVLELATDFEWSDNYTGTYEEFGNLHEYGILIAAEVYFYKNGAAEPTYTATANCDHQTATSAKDYHAAFFTHHYAKGSNCFTVLKEWKWNGATEDSATAPEFEAGTYTVKYKAYYAPITGGKYNNKANDGTTDPDRIHYTGVLISGSDGNNINNMIAGSIAREADSDLTFTVEQTYKLNAQATIDNGTTYIKELSKAWGVDWWKWDWNGLRSVNGIFESVNLAWDVIEEADKVVVEYLDQKVEVVTGLPFHVVSGLKTSPVDFTITAYQGETVLVSEKVSSDVYTLPETAAGTFNATYSATNGGWTITGEDFNTTQYATWNCSFNLYEKGSDTPVFETPITKNGKNDGYTYMSFVMRNNGWVQISKPGKEAFHVGEGEWDQGKVFNGLKGETEYEVRFELSVWPYIYDPNGTENKDQQWDMVKILITEDQASNYGVMKLAGTTSFTTGEGPAEFEALAAAEGYQGAKVTWNKLDGATGYEVYVGENKVAEADANATSVVATELTDAQKYTFTVKALGVNRTTDTPETEIYTLCNWTEPEFELQAQEDGSYKLIAHKLANLNYAYGGMTADGGKSTIEIYKGDVLQYTLVNSTPAGTLVSWAGYGRWALNAQDDRYEWTWTGVNNSTGEVKTVPAEWFTAGEYTIKYKIGYVVNKNGRWAKDSNEGAVVANREDGATMVFFGPKDVKPSPNVLYTDESKTAVRVFTKEGTASFTVAAPAPAFDLAGTWAADYTNFSSTNAMYNTAHSGKPAFTFIKLASENNKKPADGQKYYAQYKRFDGQDIYFDIDSKEIDGKPGCYAIINLIDREAGIDKVTNNNSYYDSNEDIIYIDFVTESSGSPGMDNNALGDYTVTGYLWTAKMTR